MSASPSLMPHGSPVGVMLGAGALARKVLRTGWTTPRRLVGFRALVWVFVSLMLFIGESTLSHARSAFRAIAKDAAPSIVAAAEMGVAFADIDANVASALLVDKGKSAAADAVIERRRVSVTDSLIDAAQNITHGDAEKIPIRAMSVDFGRYLERQAEARLYHERGDEGSARDAYWSATTLLHDKVLGAVDRLDKANKSGMDSAYDAQLEVNEGAEISALLVGCLLAAALVWTQAFMLRRMRRILNVPLALATLATVSYTLYLVACFADVREDLRIAKTDAFDSVYALVRARAVAHDASGDENRYLLDPSAARGVDREFRRKVGQLTGEPLLLPGVDADLVNADPSKPGPRPKSKIKGALWDEVRNITFDGEYAAASDMLTSFAAYYSVDGRVRALKQAGNDKGALELSAGAASDGSKASFEAFDAALMRTLQINQVAFDQATARAGAELKTAEIVDPGLTLVIALLAWLGFRARLREYAV